MLKKTLSALILTAATTANASQICDNIGGIAGKVYEGRQNKIPFDEMISAIGNGAVLYGQDLGAMIAIEAYRSPRLYDTDKAEIMRIEFKSRWSLWCYETTGSMGWG